jgi:hypothetical protein
MHRLATRTNLVELLLGTTGGMLVALLVLVGGVAIGEATSGAGLVTASAAGPGEVRLATSEPEVIRPTSVLCCALIYADPDVTNDG